MSIKVGMLFVYCLSIMHLMYMVSKVKTSRVVYKNLNLSQVKPQNYGVVPHQIKNEI